jgi:hypothetical protein
MGLRQALKTLLKMGAPSRKFDGGPVSMVLLLRDPRFPELPTVREAAQRGFGVKFTGDRNSRYCIYQQLMFTVGRVGPHALSFFFQTRPYGDDDAAFGRFVEKLNPEQRAAWNEHKAFMAVDYVKGPADIGSKYVVLARLCAELYEQNCTALYIPGVNSLVPGEKNARSQLSRIIADHEVDVT